MGVCGVTSGGRRKEGGGAPLPSLAQKHARRAPGKKNLALPPHLPPSAASFFFQDTEALARKIAVAGGGRVELGEIKWR